MQAIEISTENSNSQQQSAQANQVENINEVQIMKGVYFTDYRKGFKNDPNKVIQNLQQQQCLLEMVRLSRQEKQYKACDKNNLLLLESDFKNFDNEIFYFKQTIDELQEEEMWEEDQQYVEAIQENFSVIDTMYQYMIDIINQMNILDTSNNLVQQMKDIQTKKKENLNTEQQFYIHIETYRNQKAQEYQEKVEDKQQNCSGNEIEQEKEGIYL